MVTHIAIVLDRSGSMGFIKDEVVGAFNSFIESLKLIKGTKKISLNQFDHEFEKLFIELPENKIPELIVGKNYIPRGTTALYDAIGRTIIDLGKRKNVIVCIITDGAENASHEFSYDNVKKLIDIKEQSGWRFEFLSSDLKAINLGNSLGIGTTHYSSDAVGYRSMGSTLTSTVADYMKQNNQKWPEEDFDIPAEQESPHD
jgi:hypothetical protein